MSIKEIIWEAGEEYLMNFMLLDIVTTLFWEYLTNVYLAHYLKYLYIVILKRAENFTALKICLMDYNNPVGMSTK